MVDSLPSEADSNRCSDHTVDTSLGLGSFAEACNTRSPFADWRPSVEVACWAAVAVGQGCSCRAETAIREVLLETAVAYSEVEVVLLCSPGNC